MLFRQLLDEKSSTYSYLCADEVSREAVLIDPVFEQFQRDAALIRELDLQLRYTLETHVHADHVTAAWLFRERLGSRVVISKPSGAQGADLLVDTGDVVRFGAEALHVLATPGHTDGCVSYVTLDRTRVFTGDALLVRGAGRTDFQEGDAARLYRSVHDQLFTLPDATLVYPAHDYSGRTVTSVAEEKRHNPRLGGERSLGDFVGFMQNLGLPHPKQMALAVPANLRCGRPEGETALATEPAWAPVVRTFAGVPEVGVEWLAEHRGRVRIIDVRERDEFAGELGHIEGAELVPLGELRAELAVWPRDAALVLVCRSGGRSAQGAVILEKAGFGRVANLHGGMVLWRARGCEAVGGRAD